jgi:hypothetical protein
MIFEPLRAASLAELDTLVGQYVTRDSPEEFWEDCHGYFQFASEDEARHALLDPYYQKFLPSVDWSQTKIRKVQIFRPYSAEPTANWDLVAQATGQFGPLNISRDKGQWRASFGAHGDAHARTPSVAIAIAALHAKGYEVQVEHDQLDAELNDPASPHHAPPAQNQPPVLPLGWPAD